MYISQFSSVTQSCLTLCDTMDCSTQGFPVHHQLPEPTQNHVHWVGNAIQPSHSLSSPSPPAFNLSPHQGLFQWVSSLHLYFAVKFSAMSQFFTLAKVLELQLLHQSFQWILRVDFLYAWLAGSPFRSRDSQSPLQHHSSKASILWCLPFFIVQISHP